MLCRWSESERGLPKFHQYQVVGRALPKDAEDTPKIYRMKLWHTNDVRAKSKFWYFLKKVKVKVKVKKSNGQIVAINEVQSGKASEKLLFTYFSFLGFGVLAILHGLLTTSRTSSSMIGKRPMLGRKKKA
ncbi:putative ribosomal protein 50S-L18Ae/60S-L20/60S-L18A [Rosa chinensis]|uniref:Putative ribosomal protein 50S-L18Ae/60S-L20/60S-L18A n=1 Tax=Rosa chinensis TaxID=74649 RepID=A0A2P6QCG8_ROSCH|nr:60S ribosomal protein L18a isoform X1 [Rosa chinensis]PRQ31878.1 putative ribosomal protein 50S-L18Ae/60S-L20/60S-L18A [Rosa chinensis]